MKVIDAIKKVDWNFYKNIYYNNFNNWDTYLHNILLFGINESIEFAKIFLFSLFSLIVLVVFSEFIKNLFD